MKQTAACKLHNDDLQQASESDMDDIFGPIVVILLIGGIGWILGIVGYFKARRALAELEALRTVVARQPSAGLEQSARPPVPVVPLVVPDMLLDLGSEPAKADPMAPEPVTPEPVALEPPLPVEAVVPRRPRDLEELLAAKWGVWLGAAALLLSGVFLVRYASDEGLLGPGVRCVAMIVLAVALVAGAEWLRRRPPRMQDNPDYAPQALAAGAVAILMGAAYMAAVLYEMVPPLIGFVLLAAAALSGLLLSFRFGPLVAAVGIVGAFVTPLLVQTTDPFVPGLFGYLLFVAAAALAVVRYSAWVWLGWATTIACALWVLVGIGFVGAVDSWSVALFVPAVVALNLVLLPAAALEHEVGRQLAWVPVAAVGAAGLLFALSLQADGQDFIARAGVLLLVPITIAKAGAEPRLDRLPWLAAVLFLLLILFWGLPEWQPTGETFMVGGLVAAVLPGAWTPEVLRPLLATSALTAGVFAAAGLWFERRAPRPLRWSALVAVVPLLALVTLYTRVKLFQSDFQWALGALALAAGLTAAAAVSARDRDIQRAGVHAAGATAALALGLAMLLTGQWLTMAIAVLLPALAWIEARAELPPLRRVCLAVAALALVRLLLNPYVLDYATGEPPVLNELVPVYLVAILAFFVTARMLRRRGDDLAVAVLELGSVAFASVLVILEIRQWATGGVPAEPESGFRELALQVAALALQALLSLWLEARTGRSVLGWAWRIQGGLALIGGVGLILGNPAFLPSTTVGHLALANALLPAYLLPAILAGLALRRPELPPAFRPVLMGYVLVAIFAWITLEVRHVFHPQAMALGDAPVEDGELWAWSGAWLAYGLSLMAVGVVTASKPLRLAALAIVALAGAKVFLLDMAGLVGLWRVLSFLGLGLTLICLGAVFRRFVAKEPVG